MAVALDTLARNALAKQRDAPVRNALANQRDAPARNAFADERDIRLIVALARAHVAERAAVTAERRADRAVAHAEATDAVLNELRTARLLAERRAVCAERRAACADGALGEVGPLLPSSGGHDEAGADREVTTPHVVSPRAGTGARSRGRPEAERTIAVLRGAAATGRARVHELEQALATMRGELASAEDDATAALRRAARAEDRAADAEERLRTAPGQQGRPSKLAQGAAAVGGSPSGGSRSGGRAAGPALLADALRHLCAARRTGDRLALRRALDDVASCAATWRERL